MTTENDISAWEIYHKQPRYDISLQKEKDPYCYVDIHSCNTLKEAKEVAEKEAMDTGRAVIVFDRREFAVVHRTQHG